MLGRTSGDFCSFLFIFDVVYLFPGYFAMSPALHPGFSDQWMSSAALSSTPTTFDCLFFFIYRERYSLEWAFFTHRLFLPYTPFQHFWHIPDILEQSVFIKVSLGAGSYFLESCRTSYWSSKHRPSKHLSFVFMHINIAKVLLMVKTLIRSAATLSSKHENKKQQPN